MAILSVDEVREAMGLEAGTDPTLDPVILRSIELAQAMVEAFIGGPLEVTDQVMDYYDPEYRHWLYLPHRPVTEVSIVMKDDDTMEEATEYRLSERDGALVFDKQLYPTHVGLDMRIPWCRQLHVEYKSGWVTLPKELRQALMNITVGIYNLGGDFSSSSGSTGALKGLTMFDAMSMTFDTDSEGATTGGTPESVVGQWAFVLKRYVMNDPTLA